MFPQPPQNIILFDLDFDVQFPLLRLLQFLSDLLLKQQFIICNFIAFEIKN